MLLARRHLHHPGEPDGAVSTTAQHQNAPARPTCDESLAGASGWCAALLEVAEVLQQVSDLLGGHVAEEQVGHQGLSLRDELLDLL